MESMGEQAPAAPLVFDVRFKARRWSGCQRGDRSVGHVEGIRPYRGDPREWVKQAERDAGTGRTAAWPARMRKELAQLRARAEDGEDVEAPEAGDGFLRVNAR